MSQYGSYLGSGNVTCGTGNVGWKRIVYTNKSGQTAYADPYSAGSITIKPGTTVTLQMVAGRYDNTDDSFSRVGWYVGGGSVDGLSDNYYSLISSSWTPSGSYTLTTYDDRDFRGRGDNYHWGVQAS